MMTATNALNGTLQSKLKGEVAMKIIKTAIPGRKVVSRAEWLEARTKRIWQEKKNSPGMQRTALRAVDEPER